VVVHVLDELQERGFIKQTTGLDSLRASLDASPITFYVGIDPTADSMHVGHSIPLMAAWFMQQAGHKVIVIVGGGTAMIGDPSGKTEMRALITQQTIAANIDGMTPQIQRLLNIDGDNGRIVNNAEWILQLNYVHFLRHIGKHFSVNRMLAAEAYKQRLERGLSFIEFNYQLMQANDFLELKQRYNCTLQIGGDDQWGNILAGTDLIRRVTATGAHGLTFPLITTSSGAKMGKTAKGAVWLDPARTSAFDLYQYWLNVDDKDAGRMLRLFTTLPLERIRELDALQGADVRQAKRVLAREHVTRIHGAEAAEQAEQAAKAMVAGKATDDLPSYSIDGLVGARLYTVLAQAELAKSNGEAKRSIKGGAVKVNGDKVHDPQALFLEEWLIDGAAVVSVGKKRAARVTT
jgi:tyrosyl-tRNA synthetase